MALILDENRLLIVGSAPLQEAFGVVFPFRGRSGGSPGSGPEGCGVIDLELDRAPYRLAEYVSKGVAWVTGCAVRKTVAEMRREAGLEPSFPVMGINSLPGLMNGKVWEVAGAEGANAVIEAWKSRGLHLTRVPDQTGMVTPRVLFSIFNEAFLMLEEGVTDAHGLDTAMKLGVNYPLGPIEWAQTVGLDTVVAVLDALFAETADPRYQVGQLLREQTGK